MVPGGTKELEEGEVVNANLAAVKVAVERIIKDKKLRVFFASMLFFYATWQLDWSMWYIGQVQYIGMSESQLGYYNALASVAQMLTIGFFARMNVKKGLSKTLMVVVGGLIMFPIAIAGCMFLPVGVREWTFIVICVVLAMPQGCVNLIVIQMVLNILPKEGQSVMLSIYTLLITLSNCISPLLGVRLYILLGANLRGLFLFLGIETLLRIASYLVLRKKVTMR
jgi:MFS family permease